MKPLVLLLGGTTEAGVLARSLSRDDRFRTLLSLAGVTRAPAPSPVERRIGGFGGVAGLARFLSDEGVSAVVDATHPFAARMGGNARDAARTAGVALVRLTRPAWVPAPEESWIEVGSAEEAAARLGPPDRRVLLTIGRVELAAFARVPHRVVVRSVDPPPAALLPEGALVITARGPFALADELDLFRRERISVLVSKNSGGEATRAKLEAARLLGAAVVMIRRPAGRDAGVTVVTEVAAAHRFLVHACLGA